MVDINTTGLEELEDLQEIGPALAQQISDYRTTNGLFAAIEEIMEVPGIGQGVLDQTKQ